MTVSEQCKKAGLKSVIELSQLAGIKRRSLYLWQTTKPAALECLILGAAVKKERQK